MTECPQWFAQGHLRDDLARQSQPLLPNCAFMYTMCKPQPGLRTESALRTKNGNWFLMSGLITFVGDEPTTEDLHKSNSLCWRLTAKGIGIAAKAQTFDEKKKLITNFLG